MKKYGNTAVPFWLLSIYGNRVMFQWQAVGEEGGLNPTHRVRWDLNEFQLLTQTEIFGPKLIFNLKFWKTRRQLLESFFLKNFCKVPGFKVQYRTQLRIIILSAITRPVLIFSDDLQRLKKGQCFTTGLKYQLLPLSYWHSESSKLRYAITKYKNIPASKIMASYDTLSFLIWIKVGISHQSAVCVLKCSFKFLNYLTDLREADYD